MYISGSVELLEDKGSGLITRAAHLVSSFTCGGRFAFGVWVACVLVDEHALGALQRIKICSGCAMAAAMGGCERGGPLPLGVTVGELRPLPLGIAVGELRPNVVRRGACSG